MQERTGQRQRRESESGSRGALGGGEREMARKGRDGEQGDVTSRGFLAGKVTWADPRAVSSMRSSFSSSVCVWRESWGFIARLSRHFCLVTLN